MGGAGPWTCGEERWGWCCDSWQRSRRLLLHLVGENSLSTVGTSVVLCPADPSQETVQFRKMSFGDRSDASFVEASRIQPCWEAPARLEVLPVPEGEVSLLSLLFVRSPVFSFLASLK